MTRNTLRSYCCAVLVQACQVPLAPFDLLVIQSEQAIQDSLVQQHCMSLTQVRLLQTT